MVRAFLLLLLTCLVLLPSQLVWAQVHYVPKEDCAFPASKRFFHYLGDDQPVQNADLEGMPEKFGVAPTPAKPHPIEVAESQRAYVDGRLADAADAVAALARLEPADPTVLDCYARALYRNETTREQSRPVYQKLIRLLDRYGRESPTVCSIYIEYLEAYFKLATLQLDSKEWQAASYNLSRAAGALQTIEGGLADNAGLREQILQYQTECFSHLHNAALCRYFGQRTLRFFPHNTYVRPYLAALKKTAGRPRP